MIKFLLCNSNWCQHKIINAGQGGNPIPDAALMGLSKKKPLQKYKNSLKPRRYKRVTRRTYTPLNLHVRKTSKYFYSLISIQISISVRFRSSGYASFQVVRTAVVTEILKEKSAAAAGGMGGMGICDGNGEGIVFAQMTYKLRSND